MAKKTVDTKFADRDTARSIERRFLSSNQDYKEICYEYDPRSEVLATITEEPPKQTIPTGNTVITTLVPTTSTSTGVPESTSPAIAVAAVPDVFVTPKEIIQILVAQKLKKEIQQISVEKSIKELTGGKSTLQNELLGDIGNEFGIIPDSAEDMSLSLFGEAVNSNFSGALGKQTTTIIGRMISAKMPAGLSQSTIKKYLEDTWALGPLRQTAVLLWSITSEPLSRLLSNEAAQKFFDSIASQYAGSCGINLGRNGSNGKPRDAKQAVVDSSQLDALRSEHTDALFQHYKLLAKQLKIDINNDAKISQLENAQTEYLATLDLWSSEFADEFQSGIKPCFDAKKARRYAAPWNLVRQDILSLYYDAMHGRIDLVDKDLDERFLRIANRSDKYAQALLTCLTANSVKSKSLLNNFVPFGQKLLALVDTALNHAPVYRFMSLPTAPRTSLSAGGKIEFHAIPRVQQGRQVQYLELLRRGRLGPVFGHRIPYVHLQRLQAGKWNLDSQMTETLLDCISTGTKTGLSFAGKSVLLTGGGPGSIGAEVLRGLLMGGARVIVTTSRPPALTAKFYRELYNESGARGSELLVLPFNQGSKQDCKSLIDYIYSESGLQRNLDAVVPFAAISEVGHEIDNLEARSELAHRMMLTNVLRILGHIVRHKHQLHINTRPTQVLIPLSPNHGTFGGDGLYSESKLGLEGLLSRFTSESWSDYLIVCGASIGWTRGTGLMSGNDIVAETIESHNVLTFSQDEMALNLLALMTTPIVQMCERAPVFADLGGGLHLLENLKGLLLDTRSRLTAAADIRQALKYEDDQETSILNPPQIKTQQVRPRSSVKIGFPSLPDYEQILSPLRHMQGMVDAGSTIVVVGFSELGPWGSARTRWQMESEGKFNHAGYIEMAWIMNLIKHFDGEMKGKHYVGWVDAKTGEDIHDSEISERYSKQIHEHAGVRIIEPALFGGYNPETKEYLHEVAVGEDLPEFDATQATADAFKLRHGDNVTIRRVGTSDEYKVQIKRGAHMLIPKAVPCDGLVAGQIPTGWSPVKYGIPEDIVSQVDPVTLYALCCASETLYSAGIIDSLEIFKHIHLSELGNFVGSMMGGTTKTKNMYKDRYLDKPVQGDVLQETFLSTTAAWINMLLLGATGPIKTPSGACATGVEALDSGCESILTGKTKMCLVGGTDDMQEEEAYAFATMNATANAREEMAKGRSPSEMSRPTTESRSGFVESQGCGMQLITTAELAVEMGLPIYAVIASSTMAADKFSRSVPAPGQGVLSFARETSEAATSPLLDISYRREHLDSCMASIHRWRSLTQKRAASQVATTPSTTGTESTKQCDDELSLSISSIDAAARSRIQEARKLWGNDFRKQALHISPLRASLAVWGLTVDDIGIASLHGTSTRTNDRNEPDIINTQMNHLGREYGNPILAVCQKSLTGHPKAPAAAFMLNGCLQVLDNGIVPGNQNADTLDEDLRKFEHLVFPSRSIHVGDVKAFSLTSFGFGQKGGQIIGVAPRYFLASLSKDSYRKYSMKVSNRKRLADRAYTTAMITNSVFKAKTSTPYNPADESKTFLNPFARVSDDGSGNLRFDGANMSPDYSNNDCDTPEPCSTPLRKGSNLVEAASSTEAWINHITSQNKGSAVNVGLDVENVTAFSHKNKVFINRNFTEAEQTLASSSPDPQSSFAGKWSAKEAIFKSFGVASKGAGAAMKDIEILSDQGVPTAKVRELSIQSYAKRETALC